MKKILIIWFVIFSTFVYGNTLLRKNAISDVYSNMKSLNSVYTKIANAEITVWTREKVSKYQSLLYEYYDFQLDVIKEYNLTEKDFENKSRESYNHLNNTMIPGMETVIEKMVTENGYTLKNFHTQGKELHEFLDKELEKIKKNEEEVKKILDEIEKENKPWYQFW